MPPEKKSASFKDNSLDSLKAFFTVVEMAERITTGHVNYWESARKNLDKVSKTSHLWLKKPSSKVLARKLSEQWEETRQSYEDCYSKVRPFGCATVARIKDVDSFSRPAKPVEEWNLPFRSPLSKSESSV